MSKILSLRDVLPDFVITPNGTPHAQIYFKLQAFSFKTSTVSCGLLWGFERAIGCSNKTRRGYLQIIARIKYTSEIYAGHCDVILSAYRLNYVHFFCEDSKTLDVYENNQPRYNCENSRVIMK